MPMKMETINQVRSLTGTFLLPVANRGLAPAGGWKGGDDGEDAINFALQYYLQVLRRKGRRATPHPDQPEFACICPALDV